MKTKTLSVLCTIIFLLGIIAVFLGLFTAGDSSLMTWPILAIAVIYLITGWYIFKGYHPEGHPLLLFLMGYLYSSIFMAFLFKTADWPLAKTFLIIAIAWAVIQLVMVIFIRKKLPREGLIQLLIEGGLLLVITILVLILK